MEIPTVSPAVLDALADATRRAALAELVDSGATATVGELTETLAERQPGPDPGTAGSEIVTDRADLQTALHHVHLPTLAEAGGITFDPETGLVAAASNTPFDREWAARLVADHPDATYDATLAALASERRQVVLRELLADGPASDRDLAAVVAAHERGVEPAAVSPSVTEVVELSLTHTHVPALVGAGFVTRGPDGALAAASMPWRSDAWVAASPIGPWATPG
jgi:DNA-binding transcriptional ArsR family regulator